MLADIAEDDEDIAEDMARLTADVQATQATYEAARFAVKAAANLPEDGNAYLRSPLAERQPVAGLLIDRLTLIRSLGGGQAWCEPRRPRDASLGGVDAQMVTAPGGVPRSGSCTV